MKSILLGSTVVLTALNLFGQGSVAIVFTSHSGTANDHIWGPSPTDPYLSLRGAGSNDSPSSTTPYQADGMTLIGANGTGGQSGAATTFGQLLAAPGLDAESSLAPVGQPTTFHTGASAGQIVQIMATLSGQTAEVTVQGVVWDNSSGLYPTWAQASAAWLNGLLAGAVDEPQTIAISLGGGTYVMGSFNLYLIPEPSTVALAGLGTAALLVSRRRN
jgi:hypothetical protein